MRLLFLAPLMLLAAGCGNLHTQVYLFDEQGFEDYKCVKENLHTLAVMKDANGKPSKDAHQLYDKMKAFVAYTESDNALTTFYDGVMHKGNLVTPSAAAEEVRSFLGSSDVQPALPTTGTSGTTKNSPPVPSVSPPATLPSKLLLNSSLASKAPEHLYAPSRFWRQQTNTATAFGAYGNVDIAIRMDVNADYSIKGFRIDSAKLIANTVALTRQVVATVAASYGVPSTLLSNGNGSSSGFNLTDDLQRVAETVAAQQLQVSNHQDAEESMLQFISSEEGKLADDKQLSTAIDEIRKHFDLVKGELNSSSTQRPAPEQAPASTKPGKSPAPATSQASQPALATKPEQSFAPATTQAGESVSSTNPATRTAHQ